MKPGFTMRPARSVLVLVVCIAVLGPLYAQNARVLFIDDPEAILVTSGDRATIVPEIGTGIPAGSIVETGDTSIELQLEPSGGIVYVSHHTVFILDRIDVGVDSVDHRFALERGKIRTVVSAFLDDRYEIQTPSAVLGVRGTDFAQRVVPGQMDWVCVLDGAVSFARLSDDRELRVSAGAFADVRAERFESAEISRDRIEALFSDVQFRGSDPTTVRDRRERLPGG